MSFGLVKQMGHTCWWQRYSFRVPSLYYREGLLVQNTCSSAAFLPMPVDRELAVGGGYEAAALSCSRTLFGGGRILGEPILCACFLGD